MGKVSAHKDPSAAATDNKQPVIKSEPDLVDVKPSRQLLDKQLEGSSDGDTDDDEIYEVERVVGHRYESVEGLQYLMKWKGFKDKDNTYTNEASAFCKDLISEYWTRYLEAGGKRTDLIGAIPKPKSKPRGKQRSTSQDRTLPSSSVPLKNRNDDIEDRDVKPVKRPRISDDNDIDQPQVEANTHQLQTTDNSEREIWTPSSEWESWESRVEHVIAVEQIAQEGDGPTRELIIHLKWKNGKKSQHPLKEIHRRCPRRLLEFYEAHLHFTAMDPLQLGELREWEVCQPQPSS